MSHERLTTVAFRVRELMGRLRERKQDAIEVPAATAGVGDGAGDGAGDRAGGEEAPGTRAAMPLVEPKPPGASAPDERDRDVQASCVAHVSSPSGDALYADTRSDLVGRFEAWLDRVLADEPPPEGIDAAILDAIAASPAGGGDIALTPDDAEAPACDRAALWTAMTALSEEIRLQGRAFGRLDASLTPLAGCGEILSRIDARQETLATALDELAAGLRESRDAGARRAAAEAERESLDVLFDLYARLQRGMAACRSAGVETHAATRRRGWWRRGREDDRVARLGAVIESLREGYAMTLDRLRDALGRMDITPVDGAGATFDAHTMSVVDVVSNDAHAEGTVVEMYEPGFVRRDQVLRIARVKVAGAVPASDERELVT